MFFLTWKKINIPPKMKVKIKIEVYPAMILIRIPCLLKKPVKVRSFQIASPNPRFPEKPA
jgi:hypothetical protein